MSSQAVLVVKNLPAMWETQVRSLCQEDPLEKGMATPSLFLPGDGGAWWATIHGVLKSQMWLSPGQCDSVIVWGRLSQGALGAVCNSLRPHELQHIRLSFIISQSLLKFMSIESVVQSTPCEMPGKMNPKLEERLPGEISITSDMQITPHLWQKVKKN